MAVLLSATQQHRLKLESRTNVKTTDSFGTVKLVGRKREQIHILPFALEIDGNLADCLGGVGVEESSRTPLTNQSPDFRDGFQHARFVIGGHDGNQSGIFFQGIAQSIQPDDALSVYGDFNDLKP